MTAQQIHLPLRGVSWTKIQFQEKIGEEEKESL